MFSFSVGSGSSLDDTIARNYRRFDDIDATQRCYRNHPRMHDGCSFRTTTGARSAGVEGAQDGTSVYAQTLAWTAASERVAREASASLGRAG